MEFKKITDSVSQYKRGKIRNIIRKNVINEAHKQLTEKEIPLRKDGNPLGLRKRLILGGDLI